MLKTPRFSNQLNHLNARLLLKIMASTNVIPDTESLPETLKRKHDFGEDVPAKILNIEKTRIKRKKCAVLLSYSGLGYLGLQRNPGTKTIEEDLFTALLKSGLITEEGFNQPQSIQYQRAARTDKGVSAVKQILSVKLPEEVDLEALNSYLPEQIRVFGIKRATRGFNCKGSCDARTYSYTMPSFALAPFEDTPSAEYRIPQERIDLTNDVLKQYLGTHNFHNFTSRRKPLDPSAQRYMMSFTCGNPYVSDNMEFVTLKVRGQSFMLHQIRKMVGLVIAIVRGLTTVETISKSWKKERIDIPVAPSVGLVLEEIHYDRYNQRYGNDGFHDPIEWSDLEGKLEEFKKKFILSTIEKTEKEESSMIKWLENLPNHSYDVRLEGKNKSLDEEEDVIENGNEKNSE